MTIVDAEQAENERLVDAAQDVAAFPGITHAEALAREIDATDALVEDVVEAGTVGTIAGLPETHKSFLAVAIACNVAAGHGEVWAPGRPWRSGRVLVAGRFGGQRTPAPPGLRAAARARR